MYKKCFVPFLYLPISASDPNLTLLSSLPLPLLFIHLLEWMSTLFNLRVVFQLSCLKTNVQKRNTFV